MQNVIILASHAMYDLLTESLFMEIDLRVSLRSGGAGDGGSLCMVPLLICQ